MVRPIVLFLFFIVIPELILCTTTKALSFINFPVIDDRLTQDNSSKNEEEQFSSQIVSETLEILTRRSTVRTNNNSNNKSDDDDLKTAKLLDKLSFGGSSFGLAPMRAVVLLKVSTFLGRASQSTSSSSSVGNNNNNNNNNMSEMFYEFASSGKSCNDAVVLRCERSSKARAVLDGLKFETTTEAIVVAAKRLSDELLCFEEEVKQRFAASKEQAREYSEVVYAEIRGMETLIQAIVSSGKFNETSEATKKKVELFVEKKIKEALESVGDDVRGIVTYEEENRRRGSNEMSNNQRSLLQSDDTNGGDVVGRSSKGYPNKTTATVVGFILLIGAISGFLAMMNMPFPTDSLLFPKSKSD
jgi:hypothetical protein